MKRHISSVRFTDEGGVVIDFMTEPDDVRKDGLLAQSHSIMVGPHSDYLNEIGDLLELATSVLNDALDDWADSRPFVAEVEVEEDDEDGGMGSD